MSLRRTLGSLVTGPATRLLRSDIREIVEQILAGRGYATSSEVDALRASAGPDPRVAGLEERVASLEKKLNMAMGAVQASSATLMTVRAVADEAATTAKQAHQLATTARATAESAAEGVSSLEERVALDTPTASLAVTPEEECRVDGCQGRHRAKGFCARHYQQWRRSHLAGFVGPEGRVTVAGLGDRQVDPKLAGGRALVVDGALQVEGKPVESQPA